MTAHVSTAKRLSLHVHDHAGQTYAILLEVEERTAKGTLVITAQDGQPTQEHSMLQIQRSHDGTTLTCKVGAATATLTVEPGTTPVLRLVARMFFPVFEAIYTLSEADQQRLVAWIKELTVATLS